MWPARSIGSVPMRQILRKDRSRSWSVPRIDQLRLAWSPPEWVVSDLMPPNRRAPPPPHGISKRSMCRPTRLQFRGRLIRLGEMSEDDAQFAAPGYWRLHVHKESARNTGSPKARSGMTNQTPVRERLGTVGWRRGL